MKDSEIKKYIVKKAAKNWLVSHEATYGLMHYDKKLIQLIRQECSSGKVLDVGIGPGYPYAGMLKDDYHVFGIDISPDLIAKCKRDYPEVNASVGDAENLEFEDELFDCVYCFNSSWYFPDINQAISEMLRVTKDDGKVVFDMNNYYHESVQRSFRSAEKKRQIINRIVFFLKSLLKFLIGRGVEQWQPTPAFTVKMYTDKIIQFIKDKVGREPEIYYRTSDGDIVKTDNWKDFDRLVFIIKK